MAEVTEVDFGWDRADDIRRTLGRCVRDALETHGGDIAGFALVTWDMRGGIHSGYLATHGIVSESIMPAIVHDGLNRHLAVVIAERTSSDKITGDK